MSKKKFASQLLLKFSTRDLSTVHLARQLGGHVTKLVRWTGFENALPYLLIHRNQYVVASAARARVQTIPRAIDSNH